MSDLERAIERLDGHTLALVKGDEVETSDLKGIAPLLLLAENGKSLFGYSAADMVVGKAAALLYAHLGVSAVYASVLSEAGEAVFKKFGIPYRFGTCTKQIVNRKGDGMCPMEQAVAGVDVPADAPAVLRAAIEKMKRQ